MLQRNNPVIFGPGATSHFRLHKTKTVAIHHAEMKPFPTTHTQPNVFHPTLEQSQVRSTTPNSSQFEPPTRNTSQFACSH